MSTQSRKHRGRQGADVTGTPDLAIGQRRVKAIRGRMRSAPGGATNTLRGLTRSSGTSREGLAMKATRTDRRGGLRLPSAVDRLTASLSATESGCLVRTANLNQKGYSRLTVDGRQVYAHRLAWEARHGQIPDGLVICHACDNPSCCNVEHLFLGTIAANNRDMWAKGRGVLNPPKERKIPLSEHPNIRRRLASGETKTSVAATYGVSRQAIGYLVRKWSK